MSSRAIRALRADQARADIPPAISEDDEESSEGEETPRGGRTAFSAMMGDDDEDDSSSSSSSSSEQEESRCEKVEEPVTSTVPASTSAEQDNELVEEEEDLDALLSEFSVKDSTTTRGHDQQSDDRTQSPFDLVLRDFDTRDLDYDFSMRNSLLSGEPPSAGGGSSRKQAAWFGGVLDRGMRPPRLVGGGLGMTTYDRDPRPVPPPYNNLAGDEAAQQQWCTFVHSDNFERDVRDYAVIQQSGDLNALVIFVAHHPFVTPALLQLSTVLYQTNHSSEGLALLRRCLFVYECSQLVSFANSVANGNVFLLDKDQAENAIFFDALFKLVQVSYIAGLSRTCLAVSRLLLSLDPLRDPVGVLLALDHHSLAVSAKSNNGTQTLRWLVDFVDSNVIQLTHRDSTTEAAYTGDLRNLPNWAYSYALALFRLHKALEFDERSQYDTDGDDIKQRAEDALQQAMSRFPSVVGLLLQNLEVDTTGRSFRRDWVTVLDFAADRSRQLTRSWHSTAADTVVLSATLQACDLVTKIFVQQNAKLWGDDQVLQWVYDNLTTLQSGAGEELPPRPSPAVMRYASANPEDYENKIQTMPPDANIIDPGMVAHAMNVNPNRPRFLRHMQQHRGEQGQQGDGFALDADGNRIARHRLFGPPAQMVDPDWPMVEVFWRAFLPWNHVEGVPPPRRR